MQFSYSTRVKAPTSENTSGNRLYDSAALKLLGEVPLVRCSSKRGEVDDSGEAGEYKDKKQGDKSFRKTTNNSKSVVSCNSFSYIGTLNVRTAREGYKQLELASLFLESGVSILGVQEHRVVHSEEIRIERFNGSRFITVSAWRNSGGSSQGGVGVMVSEKAYGAISFIKPYGGRILTVSFDGNPRLTVINVYSPVEGDQEAFEFHEQLRAAIAEVPEHHLLLVIGDMNARLGKETDDDHGWYFHNSTNQNGKLFRDTLHEGQLEATNHRFEKRRGKMWTYLSDMTLTKAQIDYICIRKKWRNSLKNTEAYESFKSMGSDHRVVICKLKLSLRKSKTPPKKIRYDYTTLKEDGELQIKFAVEVSNRYSCLSGLEEEGGKEEAAYSATESYDKFVTAVEEASKLLLPKKQRQKRTCSSDDPRVVMMREDLNKAQERYHHDPQERNREEVAQRKAQLRECYGTVEGEFLKEKIRGIERHVVHQNTKKSWDLVNEVTQRKKTNSGLIDGGSASERLKSWKDHFVNLLGQPPSVPDEDIPIRTICPPQDIETGPFTKSELAKARKQIKEGKAAGEDGISPEIMKRVDLDEITLKFYNDGVSGGDLPDQWKSSIIIPIPKKGDLTKTDSYRGISLTSIPGKTLNRMILNRIKPCLEKILRRQQNGFRPGRSCASHILALRRILEEAKVKNLPAVMTFIDFRKAFDSVHRGILMKILRAYGIPDKIVDLIEKTYTDTFAKVMTSDGLTEAFEILAGVLQGDTLAPYLFIIVVDYIMRTSMMDLEEPGFTITTRQSRRHPAKKVADVEFADDVALITQTIKEAQEFLFCLEEAAKCVGLHMNEGKTKYLCVNTTRPIPAPLVSSTGCTIDEVDDFVYLGSWIASSEHDFLVRKAKAWAACHKMRAIWRSDLRRDLKISLFQATVESILLYGSETWTMTESLKKKIDGCYTRMLWMVLDSDWKVRKRTRQTNAQTYGHLQRVSTKIQQRRMRLAGHLCRHPELVGHELVLWEPKHGRRSQGGPKLTYVDTLRKDTNLECVNEISGQMNNRCLWRTAIDSRTQQPP